MRIRTVIRTLAAGAAVAVAMNVVTAGSVVAQEFVKVENAAREQLPAPQFVGAAYAFIWLAILAYVAFVARNLAKTRTEIEELKRRIERAGGAAPSGATGRGGQAG